MDETEKSEKSGTQLDHKEDKEIESKDLNLDDEEDDEDWNEDDDLEEEDDDDDEELDEEEKDFDNENDDAIDEVEIKKSKKKKHKQEEEYDEKEEDDEEEYENEEEDDDEEEDENEEEVVRKDEVKKVRKKKRKHDNHKHDRSKKKKKKHHKEKHTLTGRDFIDIEARVDEGESEDEEDEIEDEGFVEKDHEDLDQFKRAVLEMQAARRAQRPDLLQDEEYDMERIAAKLEEKYKDVPLTDSRPLGAVEQKPLPTIHDPKLWVVPVRNGKEREATLRLSAAFAKESSKRNPQWFGMSAVCTDSRGFIYIEAEKEIHVKKIVDTHLREFIQYKTYFQTGIQPLPVREMVQAVSVRLPFKKDADGNYSKKIKNKDDDESQVLERETFVKGVKLKVVSGDLKNLTGVVEKVDGKKIYLKPFHETFNQIVEIEAESVRKLFLSGDRVIIVDGQHKGDAGLITRVISSDDGNETLFIWSDLSNKEVEVNALDVIISEAPAVGPDSLGPYKMGDLVALTNGRGAGVITQIGLNSLNILNDFDRIESITLQDIHRKLISKTAVTRDSMSSQISTGDVIKVVLGPHKDLNGVVKHIFRGILWVQTTTDGKLAAVKGLDSRILGDKQQPTFRPRDTFRSRQNIVPTGGFTKFNDALLNKVIIIVSGPYKGQKGTVRSVTEKSVRIELQTQDRSITLNREAVRASTDTSSDTGTKKEGEPEIFGMGAAGSFTPYFGSQTPKRGTQGGMTPSLGSQTPMHDFLGSRTPHEGSMTPFTGAQTPSADVWLATTPHPYRDDDETEDALSKASVSKDIPTYVSPNQDDNRSPQSTNINETVEQIPQTDEGVPTLSLYSDVLVKYRILNVEARVVKQIDNIRYLITVPGGREVEAVLDDLQPVIPTKDDEVVVVTGDTNMRGMSGHLITIEGTEGIVERDDTHEFEFLEMGLLAKKWTSKLQHFEGVPEDDENLIGVETLDV